MVSGCDGKRGGAVARGSSRFIDYYPVRPRGLTVNGCRRTPRALTARGLGCRRPCRASPSACSGPCVGPSARILLAMPAGPRCPAVMPPQDFWVLRACRESPGFRGSADSRVAPVGDRSEMGEFGLPQVSIDEVATLRKSFVRTLKPSPAGSATSSSRNSASTWRRPADQRLPAIARDNSDVTANLAARVRLPRPLVHHFTRKSASP